MPSGLGTSTPRGAFVGKNEHMNITLIVHTQSRLIDDTYPKWIDGCSTTPLRISCCSWGRTSWKSIGVFSFGSLCFSMSTKRPSSSERNCLQFSVRMFHEAVVILLQYHIESELSLCRSSIRMPSLVIVLFRRRIFRSGVFSVSRNI